MAGSLRAGFALVAFLLLWSCSAGEEAPLLSERLDAGNTLTATYDSALFGQQVTVQVTPTSVSFSTYAPTPVMPGATTSALNVPMNETFPLPANSSMYTAVDHITVFYNPFGAYPYPKGKSNPLWNRNISTSLSCVTCWFYVTFFYIPQDAAQAVAPQCKDSATLFCQTGQLASAVTAQPDASFLPPSFVNASGDFYANAVVSASLAGTRLDRLRSVASTVTPLVGYQLGQLWVSEKKQPYTYTYNNTKVLAPSNFYVTDNGLVIGVGQVVSRDFFSFFANFFTNSDPTLHKLVNTAGPFDVPANYSTEGGYPGTAVSAINGFQGTSTFTFGFANTTTRMPPAPNAGASLVRNLPWLIASVWIAGAIVLLSDHL